MSENQFFKSIHLRGFLSFPPDSEPFEMKPLNVLVGPNGAGKSNLIEAFELLQATPTNFAQAIRDGGGPSEWIWKGLEKNRIAHIDATIGPAPTQTPQYLRYKLSFSDVSHRVEVVDEVIEELKPFQKGAEDVFFYYRFQNGRPAINVRKKSGGYSKRQLEKDKLASDQSVLSQRKDPELYPEVTWVGSQFGAIQTFREWSFGRYAPIREPQRADLPADRLLPDARNLALILNHIEHRDGRRLTEMIHRFLPRFERLTTPIFGGQVQFYLHERGLSDPIPPTRLSDGTIRFLSLVSLLLAPNPPSLLCIEEPELGLHPDAVALMAELLVEVSQRTQLVVTTHSDTLVSALSAHVDSVVVCENLGDGTVMERLDADRLKVWLDKYKLGEIWRMGELGGNP
ncbi:AAA family ATPase [Azospirillum argentinense]|uniref:Chromosome segregation protein SMC n=1 Tax=Azospirillum brasilense TaxID=192 RepID=A0A4D8PXX3_AZOBR|nr:AAA family ATPase [Azospirillum argentinense]QCO03444.1 chromosome segregation protein SMC [Azospirillum argentinense]